MTVHTLAKRATAGSEQTDQPDQGKKVSFLEFWALYPRKRARKEALVAWAKVPLSEREKILPALAAQRRSEDWRKDGGRFIPYPATWLRGERWDDELETDLTMGVCMWNVNGNREEGPKCSAPAVKEKNGVPYCQAHIIRVGG